MIRLLASALAVVLWAALPGESPAAAEAATSPKPFDVEGHRGARGVYPENTLPAFAYALSTGVTTLELDTGMTRDGVLVVSHNRRLDPAITRDPDGRWLEAPGPAIASLTLAELKRFDVGAIRPESAYARNFPEQHPVPGARVPTLAEVFALVRKSGNEAVRFNIETKLSPLAPEEAPDPETFARALVAALRGEGMAGRATIQSFDWRTLRAAQAIAPEIPTVYLTIERGREPNVIRDGVSPWLAGFDPSAHGGSLPRAIRDAGGRIWSPFFRDLDAERLSEAKALGLNVVVWTVNDPADIERLLDLGVDGIISDYPERVRAALQARGMPLPTATPVTP